MINPAPPSSSPHSTAMCNIPGGSGLGGWKERVIIGEKVCVGRKVFRRCVTGRLKYLEEVNERRFSKLVKTTSGLLRWLFEGGIAQHLCISR